MALQLVMLIIMVATTVLSGLLQKRQQVKASALGDMQVPTAEEGRNLPVIFGTCCLKAPNVVWYGDYRTSAIKKPPSFWEGLMPGGMLTVWRRPTVGHRYFLGMNLALCHGPVDALVGIRAGSGGDLQHSLSWQGGTGPPPVVNPDGSLRLFINSRNIFGGDESEGGIEGWGTMYYGSGTQTSDAYMSARIGRAYPAYRGVAHFVCNQMYLGTSPYIKNLAFILRRCPNHLGLTEAQRNINGDANPAEIIYECLQSRAWALGFPPSRFDIVAFRAAGVTLAAEGLGMSLQMDSPQQADKIIETVLQHIDGVCYTDPATGLWTLSLVRPDYVPGNIPEFTAHDIAECEFSRGSWEDTLNEVKVSYTDRQTWKQGMVQAQETANYAVRNGELATRTMEFPGFSTAENAQKVCNRELRVHSYPIGRGRVKLNRKAWALRLGSPFRLTWAPLGITGMAVRVISIDYGSLTDGAIEAEICEDVFSAAYTAYGAPAAGDWTDPAASPPQPAQAVLLHEAPYQMIVAADRLLMCGAVTADGSCTGYEVWHLEGGPHRTNTVEYFTPGGILPSPYPRNTPALHAAGFTLAGVDFDDLVSTDAAGRDRGDNLLLIMGADGSHELCAWQTVTSNGDGTYTIGNIVRGIYDTVPLDHAAGARVWIVSNGGAPALAITRELPLPSDAVYQVKLLPFNPRGTVDLGAVAAASATTVSRAARPYPPGNVRVNGIAWPDGSRIGAVDAALTWAHRHRTAQQGGAVVAQDAASHPGGPEGTYTVEVLIAGAVIAARTTTGITGAAFTYTMAQRAADDADLLKPVQFRITPISGSLSGIIRATDPFIMQNP